MKFNKKRIQTLGTLAQCQNSTGKSREWNHASAEWCKPVPNPATSPGFAATPLLWGRRGCGFQQPLCRPICTSAPAAGVVLKRTALWMSYTSLVNPYGRGQPSLHGATTRLSLCPAFRKHGVFDRNFNICKTAYTQSFQSKAHIGQ